MVQLKDAEHNIGYFIARDWGNTKLSSNCNRKIINYSQQIYGNIDIIRAIYKKRSSMFVYPLRNEKSASGFSFIFQQSSGVICVRVCDIYVLSIYHAYQHLHTKLLPLSHLLFLTHNVSHQPTQYYFASYSHTHKKRHDIEKPKFIWIHKLLRL